jgi:hypothetical protein
MERDKMELTDELKANIDKMSYCHMLSRWRFAPAGDEMFQGPSGEYFSRVMRRKRDDDPGAAVAASKALGWWPPLGRAKKRGKHEREV